MLNSWRGKVLLPLEQVVQAIEGALDRLGYAYRNSYGISIGRRVEVFSVMVPLGFTVKVREAGLIFSRAEKRPDSAVHISPADSSPPFMGSFLLELARRLPRPPWQRGKEAREVVRRTWLKVLAASSVLIGMGLFYLLFTPSTSLPLFMLILNILGIALPLAFILMTHPRVESMIQRWKWSRSVGGPELAILGWAENHT